MDLLPFFIGLAVAGIVIIGGGAFLIFFIIKRVIENRKQELEDKFRGRQILQSAPNANFFGQESLGLGQVRGNGTLLLTSEELFFSLWIPKREFRIPLAAITGVENPSTFLKQSTFKPLLKVNFTNKEGKADSMGWLVPDLETWTNNCKRYLRS